MNLFHPQSPYLKKATMKVEACQWTGDNLDEMKKFLAPYIEGDENGPYLYSEYIEPYSFASGYKGGGYNILKTEFDEFDPGTWVIVHENGDVEGMDDDEYKKMGFS